MELEGKSFWGTQMLETISLDCLNRAGHSKRFDPEEKDMPSDFGSIESLHCEVKRMIPNLIPSINLVEQQMVFGQLVTPRKLLGSSGSSRGFGLFVTALRSIRVNLDVVTMVYLENGDGTS